MVTAHVTVLRDGERGRRRCIRPSGSSASTRTSRRPRWRSAARSPRTSTSCMPAFDAGGAVGDARGRRQPARQLGLARLRRAGARHGASRCCRRRRSPSPSAGAGQRGHATLLLLACCCWPRGAVVRAAAATIGAAGAQQRRSSGGSRARSCARAVCRRSRCGQLRMLELPRRRGADGEDCDSSSREGKERRRDPGHLRPASTAASACWRAPLDAASTVWPGCSRIARRRWRSSRRRDHGAPLVAANGRAASRERRRSTRRSTPAWTMSSETSTDALPADADALQPWQLFTLAGLVGATSSSSLARPVAGRASSCSACAVFAAAAVGLGGAADVRCR